MKIIVKFVLQNSFAKVDFQDFYFLKDFGEKIIDQLKFNSVYFHLINV